MSKDETITEPDTTPVTNPDKTQATGPTPDAADHAHCFCYYPSMQHAVMYHVDRACCWCGVIRCFSITRRPVEGHGPFRSEVFEEL